MAANLSNIIIYDLETGGFTAGVHGVCEIAMICIDINTLKEIGRYEAIIKPYNNDQGQQMLYTPEAFKVNGLSMRKLEEGKDPKVVAKEVAEFAKKMKNGSKKPVLSGHNIDSFDNPHLDDFLGKHGVDVLKIFENDSIDTLKWARLKWAPDSDKTTFKLGDCCKYLGITLSNAHSAMPDVEANTKLVVNFLQSLRGESSSNSPVRERKRFRDNFKF